MRVLAIFTLLLSFQAMAKTRVPASINRAAQALSKPSSIFYGPQGSSISPELVVIYNQVKAEENKTDLSEVIPLDMQPTQDQTAVFSRIADRSVTQFFNTPEFRESSMGRRAHQVEQKMNQEVVLGQESGVQHKLNFNMEAFQSTAKVQYQGFTNAAVKYMIAQSTLDFEISEKVSQTKDLVLSHEIRPDERMSQVSLRWGF